MYNKVSTSQNRKVQQRAFNKVVRKINKNIEKDNLWRGRFVIRQDSSQWFAFPGEKDYQLHVVLKFIDKKTKKSKYYSNFAFHYTLWHGANLFWDMNNFIVDYCDAWSEGLEGLKNDKIDYAKIKI